MIVATAIIGLWVAAVGCSKNGGEPAKSAEPAKTTEPAKAVEPAPEPVTLKLMRLGTSISKDEVEQMISKPVKQKYPYITVEFMEPKSLAELLAAGRPADVPELIFTDYSNLSSVIDLKYPADLNDTLKKQKADLSKLEQSAVEGVQALDAKGQLFGLPIYLDKYMLFYNKDIFDKFAMPYPTGDMTYEDLIALVKKLTRTDNGVQYLGYRWADLYTVGYQLGLPVINGKTGKADLQTDGWKYALSFIKQLVDSGVDNKVTHDHFFKERRLGTYPQWMGAAYGMIAAAGKDFNWDMTAMPYYKETPKVSGPTKPIYLMAYAGSKNKEQAILAMNYIATSPEVQTIMSQQGRISVVKDDAIRKQFGTKVDLLAGKQTSAVFRYPFGKLPNTTAYESQAWAGLDTAPVSVINGVDVNTALRTAEEAANKKVDEYLSSRK
jgi:multiple sugar transport system substrate-binding protein